MHNQKISDKLTRVEYSTCSVKTDVCSWMDLAFEIVLLWEYYSCTVLEYNGTVMVCIKTSIDSYGLS